MKTSDAVVALGIAFLGYKLWGGMKAESPTLETVGTGGDLASTQLKSNAQAVEAINQAVAANRTIIPKTVAPSSSPDIKPTTLKSSSGGSITTAYAYDPVVKALTDMKTGLSYQTTGKVTTLATGQKVVIGIRPVA
jgi:hypothetical protein